MLNNKPIRGGIISAALALGVALFFIGSVWHLGVFRQFQDRFIFGDNGDGFFNIWVMEHVVQNLQRGNFNLMDGHIFWPDNKDTFFWSDNLIVPALGYSVFKALTQDMQLAFWWTSLLMTGFGFCAYGFLFWVLFRIAHREFDGLPDLSVLLVPLFAYLSVFSTSRLVYFGHFQNLSSLWLFALIAGAVGWLYYGQKRYIVLLVVSQVLLLYSTPYFAVMGACFVLLWTLLCLAAKPRQWLTGLWAARWGLIAPLVMAMLLTVIYMRVEKIEYSTDEICSFAMSPSALFTPNQGLLRNVIESSGIEIPGVPEETPGYLGVGMMIALLILVAIWSVKQRVSLCVLVRKPLTWGMAALALGVIALGNAWLTWIWPAGVVLVCFLLGLIIMSLARQSHKSSSVLIYGYLLLCALVAYGVALGPWSHFAEAPVNPTLWGVLVKIVPGLENMRSIGRMAVVGQGCLLGVLLLYCFSALSRSEGNTRRVVAAFIMVLILLQWVEHFGAKPYTNTYRMQKARPASDERQFFSSEEGVIAVFPTNPFHRNSSAMLYFDEFQSINLMNGYSSHSTEVWDEMMRLGRGKQEPAQEQLVFAESLGCNYFMVWKLFRNADRIKSLQSGPRAVVFENERLLVLRAP